MPNKEVSESAEHENFVGQTEVPVDNEPASLAEFAGMEDPKKEWKKEWVGMPEYVQEDNPTYKTISMHFRVHAPRPPNQTPDYPDGVTKYLSWQGRPL